MAAGGGVARVRERPLDRAGHGRRERQGDGEREHGPPTVRAIALGVGGCAWFVAKLSRVHNERLA
jgi:hypothetical protein